MILEEKTYVDKAEAVIDRLSKKTDKNGNPVRIVTTSKLRNILAMTMDIYNQVQSARGEKLTPEMNSRIEYLRVRIIYECGREASVKALVREAQILESLREINGSRKNFILFAHYLEALVAYRKFVGGDRDL
ncbi:MAG: type III-A CRISPR-associated protein Csm2 [Firmicutes bacterium]|nr:type III-A CRISPR-associated protein Csm2 [Bacillota bacterium]